ncbi:stable inheritance protein KleA [Pseudomonas juntendi]|uniref:stable inheritance protein KleA n=1 Tax=Pseudomonas juntendi TaxID=2666183 RepID=UPI003B95110B
MSKEGIMPWMDLLPGVDATDFLKRRDEVAELARQAANARFKAQALLRKANKLHGEAMQKACELEGRAKGCFSVCEVEKAKTLAYS